MADSTAAASTSEDNEQQITFNVKSSAEAKYVITVPLSTTIADLKQKLSTSEYASLPPDRQRLIYSGRVLKDTDTVTSCKIKDGNTVHLVRGAESNNRQNPANQGGAASVPPGAASNVPSNIAAGTGTGNPLAHLTGARYAGFHGLPGMEAFGADGGMGAPPNPDQILHLLEDPNFASQMNEAMNNPAVLDMMRNNPMIRNNPIARQAIENPEFRRMMMSPDVIRMQMQMQRAMGGAQGGEGGFPMPGATDTTPASDAEGGGEAAGAGTAGAGNPFAQLFGGGGNANPQQANPLAGLFGAPQEGSNQANPLAQMTQTLMQNPQMMQQMMQMMGNNNNNAAPGEANPAGAGGAQQNPFGGFNPFAFGEMPPAAPQSPPDNRPPEERYEDQLRQLNDMGFYEFERNVQALRRSGGSVQGAVEYLLNN